ncbi:chemotaxis-related protein WspD [Burkholderia multivorans]
MDRIVPDSASPAVAIDACWSRIGTLGDGSCTRLADCIRCLNCPVFEQAAALLRDRPLALDAMEDGLAPETPEARTRGCEPAGTQPVALPGHAGRSDASLAADEAADTQSIVVFRIADEWLALPAASILQIDELRPIHPLPHRRNDVTLGLVNVRGSLTVAASLAGMLNIDRSATVKHASRTAHARMLIVEHHGDASAFPVDEVEGVLRFAAPSLLPVPATLSHAAAVHTRGVLAWRGTTIGLLDADHVFASLARSL